MRPPLSSSIRSAAGAGAALLTAGCATAIMVTTNAKRSEAMQRCVPDSMFYRLKTSRYPDNDTHSQRFWPMGSEGKGPTCPHSRLQGTERQSSALLRNGEGSVGKFQDHQRRAAECLRLAREATDKTNKALLIEMAQTWAKLAEQDKARSEDEKQE
jgi:hypothetical protein